MLAYVLALVLADAPFPADWSAVAAPPPKKKAELVLGARLYRARMAVGEVRSAAGQGSGTVVGPRRPDGRWDVLTAHHVSGGQDCTLTLPGGQVLDLVPVACDRTGDLCWMATRRTDIDYLPAAPLATRTPAPGEKVWQCGYGVGCRWLVREGQVGPARIVAPERIHLANIVIASGDSGAGVFDAEGALVGVVTSAVRPHPTRPGEGMAGTLDGARRLRPGRLLPLLPRLRR